MPHKRAKRTIRQLDREKRGADLPPSGNTSIAQESIPKSLTRVLYAESVRTSYKAKRVRNDGTGDEERDAKRRRKDTGDGTKKVEIKHGESLAHFNRRVDEDMRVPVAEAMHASRNHAKRVKKSEALLDNVTHRKIASSDSAPSTVMLPSSRSAQARKTEFDTRPSAKRLNDVAQEPPVFTKLPRGAAKVNSKTPGKIDATVRKTEGIVTIAQKRLMDEERERAIRRYRELKSSKLTIGMEKS